MVHSDSVYGMYIFEGEEILNLTLSFINQNLNTIKPLHTTPWYFTKQQLSTQLFNQPYIIDKQMDIYLDRAYIFLSEYILSFHFR